MKINENEEFRQLLGEFVKELLVNEGAPRDEYIQKLIDSVPLLELVGSTVAVKKTGKQGTIQKVRAPRTLAEEPAFQVDGVWYWKHEISIP